LSFYVSGVFYERFSMTKIKSQLILSNVNWLIASQNTSVGKSFHQHTWQTEAFLSGTLPGRDQSNLPHPCLVEKPVTLITMKPDQDLRPFHSVQ
jgi:hypothetical protein